MQKTLFFVLIGVLALWWMRGARLPDFITNRTLDRKFIAKVSKNDSCAGKTSCLLVYVAPWCPACKSLDPILKMLVKSSGGESGVKIVVGQGHASGDNEKLAETYGANGVVDADNSYHDKLKVRYYPTIFQFDAKGNVLKKDNDALQWAAMNILTDDDRKTLSGR